MIRAVWAAISVPCFAQPEYYITSVCFCQGVFQNFFKFFSAFFKPFSSNSFSERMWCTLYHIRFTLSSTFSKVFQLFSWFLVRCFRCGLPLRDSLHIIALHPPFVNPFLTSFFTLELQATMHKQRASRLYNLPKKWLIIIPNRGMRRVLNAHFPRL